MDSMTRVPQVVVDDIQGSMAQIEGLLGMTSAVNGTLTFTSETEKSVTFSTPMSSTGYRVYLTPSDFVSVRVTSKLVTGFTAQVSSTFTGTIGYDVFI